ncbi:uncharacterized protein LOC119739825 [Patiria miniata]|uniref:PLL-like beta propeller domain-containing protein n=1 Tax=Patiria miniata TaxID=46514 RepID=A0A914B4W0_PATMI|nr:uncharacterized protein LOC119739825 [Patiria miniata]
MASLVFRIALLGLSLSVMMTSCVATSISDNRVFVIKNLLDNTTDTQLAFRVSKGGLQYATTTSHIQPYVWSKWIELGAPQDQKENPTNFSAIVSNPVGLHASTNQTQIFVQTVSGQVCTIKQELIGTEISFGKWAKLPSLEYESGTVLHGQDSITVGTYKSQIVVFTRSMTGTSGLFWCKSDAGGEFSAWQRIGDVFKAHLFSDATVIFNTFSGYYEAFAVMSDGYVYRTWQRDDTRWANWRSMGIFQPKVTTTSRPVANVMSHSFANGVLEVFALGADSTVKHIFQTTCDTVDNPWGYCTWGLWHTLSGKVPPTLGANVIATGTNVHLGGELFLVDTKGILWHVWQTERGTSWSDWQQVPTSPPTQPAVAGKAFVRREDKLWWKVFAQSQNGTMIVVEQARSLDVVPSRVAYGANLTVSWSVPVDEATHMDWIGVYPVGANNDQYVDFKYVQGGQNPLDNPVPKGNIALESYLPDGIYDVRYLVNRQFVDVIDTTVEYNHGNQDEPWVQVFRGIFHGLGAKTTNFKQCVQDGNKTVATFRESFEAFGNKEVFKGLQMLGVGLKDVEETLKVCSETDIAKALEQFVTDLISCVEGHCLHFVIDAVDILLILYENVYEIFGDIRAASNSFNVAHAYEQGGLCIGRVVNVCISLPWKNGNV